MSFDVARIRAEFPLIAQSDSIYLDNAATTQKPLAVLDAQRRYYETMNANVHRAAHALSEAATTAFEDARGRVARFLNASAAREIIWTRGTTEAINLVAHAYAPSVLGPGDEVLITELEHHSNIVPWQMACAQTGATLKAARVTSSGEIDRGHFDSLLSERTRIVAVGHVSNALGTVNPIAELIAQAHEVGAVVLIDGAQGAPHFEVDVQALDCDFYAFSGHKAYGPTGIGALYGREALLDAMPPWQGGGEMIEDVTIEKTTYQGLPYKFEAGTPNIAGAIALASALEYLGDLDANALRAHEADLLTYTTSQLLQIEGIEIVGTGPQKGPVVSFLMSGAHPHDVGTLLDQQGVAVRTGHHCAMPLMRALQITGTVRASFSLYNSRADVDRLVAAVNKARSFV